MKKLTILFLGVIFLFAAYFTFIYEEKSEKILNTSSRSTSTPLRIKNTIKKTSIFVPYWSMGKGSINDLSFDTYIYFGISVNKLGIDKEEAGFKDLSRFDSLFSSGKKYLAVRMIDSDSNSEILKNQNLQKKIIKEALSIAHDHSYDGIVLDFETPGLSFDSSIERISSFINLFYQEVQKNNLRFSVALYGDVFYRARPFDVAAISKNSDEIIVMAYDFHKARGNPGPNFPLDGRNIYGYDFKQMIEDFLKVVPAEKLSVAFGMFGYDWIVDTSGQSVKNGQPLSLGEINKRFIAACEARKCVSKNDSTSQETQILYIDSESNNHVVWFENEKSVEKKKEYLQSKGLYSISYWAYSYY